MRRTVVITGMGIVSPFGVGLDVFWNAISNGVSGIGPITAFDPQLFPTSIGGEVKNFDPVDFVRDSKSIQYMTRSAQMGVAAASMALEDAGIELDREDPTKIGVITGTGTGNVSMFEKLDQLLCLSEPASLEPQTVLRGMPNAVSIHIANQFCINGYNNSIYTTCAAGTQAVGDASCVIESDRADVMIAGGTDISINPVYFGGYSALGVLSTRNDNPRTATRPFDRSRDGFVLSDGGGMLILEELEHARRRGARIYATIMGFGVSCDSYRLTDPHPGGIGPIRAIRQALRISGISPDQINHINAHGTATPKNDIVETKIIKTIFGEEAYRIPINSLKSMIGHGIGAAGAMELIGMVLTMHNSVIPPTINLNEPDPECDLDYVPNVGRECKVDIALKNSFGFGGHNAVIILRKGA